MVREKTDVLVLGIRKPGAADYIYNPPRSVVLESGYTLVVLGSREQVAKLKSIVKG